MLAKPAPLRAPLSSPSAVPAWVATTTPLEIAAGSQVVAEFLATVLRRSAEGSLPDAGTMSSQATEHIARALVLRRLVAEDASIEALLDLAEEAGSQLNDFLLEHLDPRKNLAALSNTRRLTMLGPVLAQCGHMLAVSDNADIGKRTSKAAEQCSSLVFHARDVAPFLHGSDRPIGLTARVRKRP